MEKDSAKRRGWIKNVAIVFLIILLLLTFFSNTILTYSLPEVSAQYTQYTTISSTTKLTGTVSANESYSVVYENPNPDAIIQSRKVVSVYAKAGDFVEKDQVIIALAGGMSEELKAVQDEYNQLKKEYDLAKIGDNTDYLQSSKTLDDAQREYDDAVKELESLNKDYETLTKGTTSDAIKEKIKSLTNEIAELEIKIADTENTIAEIKGGMEMIPGNKDIQTAEREYTLIMSQYMTLKDKNDRMSSELTALRKQVEDMATANSLTMEIDSLNEQNRLLFEDVAANIETIMANNQKISDCEQKLAIIGQPHVSDVELFQAQRTLAELEDEYEGVSVEYAKIEPEYEAAKALVDSLRKKESSDKTLADYSALLKTYKDKKADLEKKLGGLKDPEELKANIKTQERTVSSLKSTLDILKSSTYQSNKSTQLEREEQLKRLNELSEKIKEYENAPETLTVTAPIAGRIVDIFAVAGSSISSGETVAAIEIADKGYICEISVSSEEARKVSVGAPISVSNSWWYSNIEASITQIKSDVKSQGKNKIVVINVSGDVYEGQSLTFSVGDKSTSYDSVLPNSAIRDDSDGKFVLVVESKNTVLGVRYTARRKAVEILASDDTKSAVTGLYGSEFVITNATAPISDGQQIRLADD